MSVILLAVLQTITASTSFAQAKSLADENEARLSNELMLQLVQAQRNALGEAMDRCSRPGMDLTAFTVVFSLDQDGSIKEHWRQGETPLAKCVHGQIVASGLAGRWPSPFYTSIELSFGP